MDGVRLVHPCGFVEKCWERRHCGNNECSTLFIHRDHAAWINIGIKFHCFLNSEPYPVHLRRGVALAPPPAEDGGDDHEEGFDDEYDIDEMIQHA